MHSDEQGRGRSRARHGRAVGVRARLRALVASLQDPRNRAAAAILAIAIIVGSVLGLISIFGSDDQPSALPPTPPSPSAASLSPGTSLPSPPSTKKPAAAKPIRCSTPKRSAAGSTVPFQICVPRIGVDASVMQLGLNSDRTVEVPPLSRVGDAGWYKYSAAPGNVGPTVILGHVDSARYGEGVFYRLGTLHAGDKVVVTREDGMIATYRVGRVVQVPKKKFPTDAVYGSTSGSAIRLVTCGGRYNASTGNYVDNIIAYGTLQSLRQR